jgi:SAM-dependent methyltransferase
VVHRRRNGPSAPAGGAGDRGEHGLRDGAPAGGAGDRGEHGLRDGAPAGGAGDRGAAGLRDTSNVEAWDRLYRSCGGPVWGPPALDVLAPFLTRVAVRLGPRPRLLDAATGEGRHLPALRGLGTSLCACDASAGGLARIPASERSHTSLVTCNLSRMPFSPASFDFVLLWDTCETLPDAEAALAEIGRVTRAGGLLLANIPGPDDGVAGTDMTPVGPGEYLYQGRYFYRFMTDAEARALLGRHGFAVEDARQCRWHEAPHEHFRPAPHEHTSNVFLGRRGP